VQPFRVPEALTGVSEVTAAAAPTDRQLADRIVRDGDEAAFRALYRRHTPGLYRFALRLLGGNVFDAEDVVQQTWLKGVEGLPRFRWEAGLATWLHGIALNCCRASFRRKDSGWLAMDARREPLATADMPHERIDLESALTRLPPGYRTVVVLHDVEGLTHEEIAEQLGVSANTSKSQLSRGRRMLRSMLTPPEGWKAEVQP
jgi:RNA polymerase sigma-70 factor (ECF subfamily)